jgi:hypothetical protein
MAAKAESLELKSELFRKPELAGLLEPSTLLARLFPI